MTLGDFDSPTEIQINIFHRIMYGEHLSFIDVAIVLNKRGILHHIMK